MTEGLEWLLTVGRTGHCRTGWEILGGKVQGMNRQLRYLLHTHVRCKVCHYRGGTASEGRQQGHWWAFKSAQHRGSIYWHKPGRTHEQAVHRETGSVLWTKLWDRCILMAGRENREELKRIKKKKKKPFRIKGGNQVTACAGSQVLTVTYLQICPMGWSQRWTIGFSNGIKITGDIHKTLIKIDRDKNLYGGFSKENESREFGRS